MGVTAGRPTTRPEYHHKPPRERAAMPLPYLNGAVATVMKDPELRWTPGGKAVAKLTLLFEKRKKDDSTGKWETVSKLWVTGTVWDKKAEFCQESLEKLDEVIVSGELSMREYERGDGSKGQSLELNISAIGPTVNRFPVKVARADRSTSRPASQADDPWGQPPPSGGNFGDEPPF